MDKNLKSDIYDRKILEKTEIHAEIITFACTIHYQTSKSLRIRTKTSKFISKCLTSRPRKFYIFKVLCDLTAI